MEKTAYVSGVTEKVVNLKVSGEFNNKNASEVDRFITFKNGMTLGGSRGRNYILDTTGLNGNPTKGIYIENNDIVVKNCIINPRTIELSFKGTPITKVYDGTTDTEQTLSDLFGLYGTDGLLSEEYERLLKVYGKFADAEPGKNKVVDFGTTVGSNYTLVFKDLNGNILQPSFIVGEITGKPVPPEPIPPEPEIKSDITIGTLLRNDSASMVFEALNVNAAMTRPSEDNRDDGVIGAAPNGVGLTAENQARLADSYNKVSDDDSSADEKKKKKTGSKKSS